MAEELIELRGEVPRSLVDVLDAVAMATPGASRITVLRQILAEWAERKIHEASLIARVRHGTGCTTDAGRKPAGDR